ncbi:hypothetical protein GCM10008171_33070 [Methylopila jiangsuensis]|uniref:Uncharacterized protein n=1 Tax=Methylopila jiangsuensis TaxID=586230 RepID=A0A9W6JM70_9HYPH|nr:hypothetical protein [Methylopila jiangsuensis]MDR6284559.1 hypothetical protein [Methylopila jiangsuensis]GLK78053.1 hypothetical protein GCM10008171_33070 [Methylopila jiangsuensis]
MTPDTYPTDLLQCQTMSWQVIGGVIEGLRSIEGASPDRLPIGRGGLWRIEMQEVFLETREEWATWRAIRARQRNGATAIVVPLERRPYFAQGVTAMGSAPHSDGSPFSDGSEYATATITAEVLSPAAHAAVALRVRVWNAEPLIGAEPFTIVHPLAGARLYEVIGLEAAAGPGGSTDYELRISPPLRQAVSAGEAIDFNRPRCLMRLEDPNGMEVEEDIVSFPSVAFVEHLTSLRGEPA